MQNRRLQGGGDFLTHSIGALAVGDLHYTRNEPQEAELIKLKMKQSAKQSIAT